MNCDTLFCLSALCCIWTLNSNLVFGAKKDLYGILGIERTANEKDIKRAFRKLAVKYHPDKNKDPDAEKQFMEIAKAYEVLSDPERRRRYDQYGDDGEQSSGGGGGGGFNFNFNDFFKGYDEAFKTHHDHDHHHTHQDGFKFHFGGGNGGQHAQFFNFDDLFEDEDDNNNDFLNFDPFSNLDMNFGFGFDDDDDDDIFGHQVHNHYDRAHNQHAQHMHNHAKNMHQHKQQHMNMEHNMHAHHNMKMENVRVNSQGGRTCRTVTQRVGNTVTTHTECS